jgi:hypothetical protein
MKGICVENVVSNLSKFDKNISEYISKTNLEIFMEIFRKQPGRNSRAAEAGQGQPYCAALRAGDFSVFLTIFSNIFSKFFSKSFSKYFRNLVGNN